MLPSMNTPHTSLSRRDMLAASGLAAVGAAAGLVLPSRALAAPAPSRIGRKRSIRLAHMTDIHVQPEKRAGDGLTSCLHHVQSQKDKPDLILTGGDSIMDCMDATIDRTKQQWDLWHKVFKGENTIPVESCLGNHDVFGWNKTKSKTTGTEPLWGKRMAEEMLRMSKRYRSFDKAGWHFIVLDSVFPAGEGYTARLDDEQMEWLKGDLAATPATTPVLVLSHIPIVAACVYFFGTQFKGGEWKVPGSWMHEDARQIVDLFLKHRNVKVCLSGHIHLIDRVDFQGVSYLCDGAVSANWWKGKHQECNEGYGLINLYDDGSFDHEYMAYGWKAELEKK